MAGPAFEIGQRDPLDEHGDVADVEQRARATDAAPERRPGVDQRRELALLERRERAGSRSVPLKPRGEGRVPAADVDRHARIAAGAPQQSQRSCWGPRNSRAFPPMTRTSRRR